MVVNRIHGDESNPMGFRIPKKNHPTKTQIQVAYMIQKFPTHHWVVGVLLYQTQAARSGHYIFKKKNAYWLAEMGFFGPFVW